MLVVKVAKDAFHFDCFLKNCLQLSVSGMVTEHNLIMEKSAFHKLVTLLMGGTVAVLLYHHPKLYSAMAQREGLPLIVICTDEGNCFQVSLLLLLFFCIFTQQS